MVNISLENKLRKFTILAKYLSSLILLKKIEFERLMLIYSHQSELFKS